MARRSVIVAAIGAGLLSAACGTAPGSPAASATTGPATTSAGPATTSAAPATTAAGPATAGGAPAAGSTTTNPQTGGYNPGDNATGTAPGGTQPGGDPTARAYLAGKGWINPAGQVVAQAFNLNGNGQSDDQAFCTYVFGTADQIAKASRISATTVTFDDSASGSQGDGTILCAYNPPGQTGDVLGMGVGNAKSLNSTAAGGRDVLALPAAPGEEVVVGYSPSYGGPTAAPAALKAWLEAALARLDFTGMTDT